MGQPKTGETERKEKIETLMLESGAGCRVFQPFSIEQNMQVDQRRKEFADSESDCDQYWLQIDALQQQLQTVLQSRSWRMTKPLRWIFGQARRLKAEGLASRLKSLAKKMLRKLDRMLSGHPVVRKRLIGWAQKVGLHAFLKRLRATALHRKPWHVDTGVVAATHFNASDLTRRAQQIHGELKAAIARQQKAQV